MILEKKGFYFFTLVHALNTDGVVVHACMNKGNPNKGYFMYSLDGTNNFKPTTLEQLLTLLIDNKFEDKGRIRMRCKEDPSKYGNNALAPIFKRRMLIVYDPT